MTKELSTITKRNKVTYTRYIGKIIINKNKYNVKQS